MTTLAILQTTTASLFAAIESLRSWTGIMLSTMRRTTLLLSESVSEQPSACSRGEVSFPTCLRGAIPGSLANTEHLLITFTALHLRRLFHSALRRTQHIQVSSYTRPHIPTAPMATLTSGPFAPTTKLSHLRSLLSLPASLRASAYTAATVRPRWQSTTTSRKHPKTALFFPGQGVQRVGMSTQSIAV